MARTNTPDSGYPIYNGHQRTVAELGDVGLSVFRSFESSQFDSVFHTLEEVLGDAVIRIRGQGMERPPVVSLLEINEVKRQKALGRLPVRETINEVYESIGSLRHGIAAIPSRVQLLGRSGSKSKVLVTMFEEETERQLAGERTQILETLEGLAVTPYEFNWLHQKRPHISLARMSASQIEKATAEVRYKIQQSLPPTVALHRATLYNPSHSN